MGILARETLENMGFAALGANLMISSLASFHNCAAISLGSNVRIDDFCILSAGRGGIDIGNHVHIAAYSSLIGAGRITLSDFCNLSSRVSVYSSTDDYSGEFMTNPTVAAEFTGVRHADVFFGQHVIIGCGSTTLPGVRLDEGVAVGALSLVNTSCPAFGIYSGIPARRIKERQRDLLDKARLFLESKG
ncbi:MAG: galactoside O-acetyltransferase [Burkholderiales bacterium PBB3]|nr:MAG: galactoside O-acetyltransferase [Burkholderiales bacterium PBB3]